MKTTTLTQESMIATDQDWKSIPVASFLTNTSPGHMAKWHLLLALFFGAVAVIAAAALRVELLSPALNAMQPRTFGALLTLHGTLLVYFVAFPAFPGILGHAMLSAVPGYRSAFPRLAPLSWQLLALGGAIVLSGFVMGGSEVGWSFDAAFNGRFDQPGVISMAGGVLIAAIAIVILAVEAIVSGVMMLREPQRTSRSLPLVLSSLCGACIMVFAAPILATCMVSILADAVWGLSLFQVDAGGDPLLFLAFMRAFLVLVPGALLIQAFGVAFDVIIQRCQVRELPRLLLPLMAVMTLLTLSGPFWGGYFLRDAAASSPSTMAGMSAPYLILSILMLIQLQRVMRSGLKKVDAPLIYALGFFVTLIEGLGAGMLLSLAYGGDYLNGTLFVTAQMHLVVLAVLGMGFIAGLYACWQRLTGRVALDFPSRLGALLVIGGTQLTFVPMMALGFRGASFRANAYPGEFQILQVMITAGSTILIAGLAIAALTLLVSRKSSRLAAT